MTGMIVRNETIIGKTLAIGGEENPDTDTGSIGTIASKVNSGVLGMVTSMATTSGMIIG
jgi:hypothetical protein